VRQGIKDAAVARGGEEATNGRDFLDRDCSEQLTSLIQIANPFAIEHRRVFPQGCDGNKYVIAAIPEDTQAPKKSLIWLFIDYLDLTNQ